MNVEWETAKRHPAPVLQAVPVADPAEPAQKRIINRSRSWWLDCCADLGQCPIFFACFSAPAYAGWLLWCFIQSEMTWSVVWSFQHFNGDLIFYDNFIVGLFSTFFSSISFSFFFCDSLAVIEWSSNLLSLWLISVFNCPRPSEKRKPLNTHSFSRFRLSLLLQLILSGRRSDAIDASTRIYINNAMSWLPMNEYWKKTSSSLLIFQFSIFHPFGERFSLFPSDLWCYEKRKFWNSVLSLNCLPTIRFCVTCQTSREKSSIRATISFNCCFWVNTESFDIGIVVGIFEWSSGFCFRRFFEEWSWTESHMLIWRIIHLNFSAEFVPNLDDVLILLNIWWTLILAARLESQRCRDASMKRIHFQWS